MTKNGATATKTKSKRERESWIPSDKTQEEIVRMSAQIDQMSRLDADRQVQMRARRILHTFGADRATSSWWHDIAVPVSGDDDNGGTP